MFADWYASAPATASTVGGVIGTVGPMTKSNGAMRAITFAATSRRRQRRLI